MPPGSDATHLLVFVVLEAVELWKLALMQDANDPNAAGTGPIEHHVAHVVDAEKPWLT
jgi:hypothetical protein